MPSIKKARNEYRTGLLRKSPTSQETAASPERVLVENLGTRRECPQILPGLPFATCTLERCFASSSLLGNHAQIVNRESGKTSRTLSEPA